MTSPQEPTICEHCKHRTTRYGVHEWRCDKQCNCMIMGCTSPRRKDNQ